MTPAVTMQYAIRLPDGKLATNPMTGKPYIWDELVIAEGVLKHLRDNASQPAAVAERRAVVTAPPPGDEVPVVYVELIESPARRRWWVRRPQKWRWVARSGGNNRILATSGESYVNRGDALSTIQLIFGYRVDVYLRQPQLGSVVIRSAKQ